MEDARLNLFGLDRPQLSALMREAGQPDYRAGQVYRWLYARRARSITGMSDLPRALRETLQDTHALRWPEVAERNRSRDGTVKYLFRLDDRSTIESVYIPDEARRTICISTQAGCPLKCGFCLTGIAGYTRNLKPWEILGQVAAVMAETAAGEDAALGVWGQSPEGAVSPQGPSAGIHSRREPPNAAPTRPWNIVVMGMGEPLLNYEATAHALRIFMDPEGFAIPPRKLTLSTVGILPALEKLAQEPVRPNLAISLHASNPELRARLMPIEHRYPMAEVVAAALRYPVPRGGRVTFEYVLLRGVNDAPENARELARLLQGSHSKVNLIPLNAAVEIPFEPPTEAAVDAFCRVLTAAEVPVSVRRSRGQDILAACGQLQLRRGAEQPQLVS
jgi:23S rRNA (adenine2503-C2)-methyltransferase